MACSGLIARGLRPNRRRQFEPPECGVPSLVSARTVIRECISSTRKGIRAGFAAIWETRS